MEYDHELNITLTAPVITDTLTSDLTPAEAAMLVAISEDAADGYDPADIARMLQKIQINGLVTGDAAVDEPTEGELAALIGAHEGEEVNASLLDAALTRAGSRISVYQAGPTTALVDTDSSNDNDSVNSDDNNNDTVDTDDHSDVLMSTQRHELLHSNPPQRIHIEASWSNE
jgi:aspartokinase